MRGRHKRASSKRRVPQLVREGKTSEPRVSADQSGRLGAVSSSTGCSIKMTVSYDGRADGRAGGRPARGCRSGIGALTAVGGSRQLTLLETATQLANGVSSRVSAERAWHAELPWLPDLNMDAVTCHELPLDW